MCIRDRDYPTLRIVKLEQNYRCSNRVLRAANALIANNPHDHLKTCLLYTSRCV